MTELKALSTTRMAGSMGQRNDTITTLYYYWDDQPGVEPGWYVQAHDAEDRVRDHSMHIWFPVDTDDFDEDQEADLVSALKAAFPDAEIEKRG